MLSNELGLFYIQVPIIGYRCYSQSDTSHCSLSTLIVSPLENGQRCGLSRPGHCFYDLYWHLVTNNSLSFGSGCRTDIIVYSINMGRPHNDGLPSCYNVYIQEVYNCLALFKKYKESGNPDTGKKLMTSLKEGICKQWSEEMAELDFTHSS